MLPRGTIARNTATRIVWRIEGEAMRCLVGDCYGTFKVGDMRDSTSLRSGSRRFLKRFNWVIVGSFRDYVKLVR